MITRCVSLLLLALVLVFAGCGAKPTPAPAVPTTPSVVPTTKPVSTPTSTPTPTQLPATVKPIELKLASALSPLHHFARNVDDAFANAINKETGGRVKITVYHAEALAKMKDLFNLAVGGGADISQPVPSYSPDRFALSLVAELPFACESGQVGSKAIWTLYKEGLLARDITDFKLITMMASTPYHLFSAKKPIASLNDLKGMKVRATVSDNQALLAVGATPVDVTGAEIYMAMQKGLVDATVLPYASMPGYKLQEITKYMTETGSRINLNSLIMNKASWDKLPPDIQDIFNRVGEQAVEWGTKSFENEDASGRDILLKAGVTAVPFPASEREKWMKLMEPVWSKWVADNAAKGLPAKAVYDRFLSILKGLGVKMPF